MTTKLRKIEISPKTIIYTILFLLLLKVLASIYTVLVAVFISFLISTAVFPLVRYLNRFKIPHSVSAFFILIILLIGIFSSFASLLPLVVNQTTSFLDNLPRIIDQLDVYNIDASIVTSQLGTLPSQILQIALDTFSVAIFLITTFVMSFYLILERPKLESNLALFLTDNKKEKIYSLVQEVETRVGHWVRGELFLMICIGLLTYVSLTLIGIDYALPLAIIAGLLELVPNIGPTVAAIPAAIVGFATSPFHGLLTVIASIIIQQLENSLIVPIIMRRAIGLHPIITIITLMIGFQLGGPLLAVLALPLVLVIEVTLRYLYLTKSGEVKLVSPKS